jgi:hypothetical protein
MYVRHETVWMFKARKLRVDFRILEYPEVVISRWYNLLPVKSRVACAKQAALVREVSDGLGRRVRHDRVPVADLEGYELRVLVQDVEADSAQQPLSELNRYSVVKRIIGNRSQPLPTSPIPSCPALVGHAVNPSDTTA